MRKYIFKGMFHLVIVLLLGGCTASHYTQGKRSLRIEDYDSAIESFELAKEKHPENLKVLRELGIAYYSKIQFDKAIPNLIQAFLLDSTDGRTLFYLGTAYEITKDIPHAMDIYRRYVDVSGLEYIKGLIEARLVRLLRKQMEEEVKAILAQEKAIDAASIPDSTVAVLYFKNVGRKKELDPIQKGITEMMITDLSKVKSLKVVERIRMQKLMEEIGLGMTGLVDNRTAPRVGRLLGASRLIKGTFIGLRQDRLRIDAGLISTKKRKTTYTKRVRGELANLFKLEKDLVFEVVDKMGIKLSQEEIDEIEVIPTESFLAFMAYCRGLDFEDRGLFPEATQQYQNAIELDPNFIQAGQNLSESEKMTASEIEVSKLEEIYTETTTQTKAKEKPVKLTVTEEKEPDSSEQTENIMDQMLHMGTILDQGFLPGVESREPAQEQSQSSFGSTVEFKISVPIP
jgi:TolB-like protein/Tfp pilus assembly protein PilF